MLAQFLALHGATNLRKSMKRGAKAVDSPQVNMERPVMPICYWQDSASFSINTFYYNAAVSALLLICS